MTSTGTKVIAFELGLLIPSVTWIPYDGLPWTMPQIPRATPPLAYRAAGLLASIALAVGIVQRLGPPWNGWLWPVEHPTRARRDVTVIERR